MAEQTYEDLVLEVGTELEYTVKGGDFLTILERHQTSFAAFQHPKTQIKKISIDFVTTPESDDVTGSTVAVAFTVPAKFVLADRPIKPQDVADLFNADQGGNRSINVVEEDSEQCFVLTQRHIIDDDFMARISNLVKLQNVTLSNIKQANVRAAETSALKSKVDSDITALFAKMDALKPPGDDDDSRAAWLAEWSDIKAKAGELSREAAKLNEEIAYLKSLTKVLDAY